MKNFLLPWLNKENESLTKLPNNPLNKLQLSSSFNTPNGGFLGKKAPITPIPHTVPITPVPQTSTNPVPMTPVPQHILPQMPKGPLHLRGQHTVMPNAESGFTELNMGNNGVEQKTREELNTVNKQEELKQFAEFASKVGSLRNLNPEYLADQFPLLSSNAEAREYLQSDIEKISNQEKTMEELLSVYSKHFPGYLSEEGPQESQLGFWEKLGNNFLNGGQTYAKGVEGLLNKFGDLTIGTQDSGAEWEYLTQKYNVQYPAQIDPETLKKEREYLKQHPEVLKDYGTTLSHDVLNVIEGGADVMFSIGAPVLKGAMAVAGATEAGEWALSGLDKVFGKAGEIVNHLPVLKQFRDSLSEEDKKRFDSFIGGSVTALFGGLKGKRNLIQSKNPAQFKKNFINFVKENSNPLEIINNFQENVLNIPKKFLPTRQKAQTVSGGKKTTPVVGEVVTKPQKPSIIEDWSGVTQDLKQRVQNNAYVQEYAKPMLEEIDRDGVPSNKDEYINRHLETKLQEIAEGLEEQKNLIKNEGGKVYKQIRETNVPIELGDAKTKVETLLNDKQISVKDGRLNFDQSAIIKAEDATALQRVYDRIASGKITNAEELLNLRKVASDLSKYDKGVSGDGVSLIRGMRKVIDEIAKEQIPGLREADAHYADMIDVLDEMQEGIVYKEVARKGQLKDNAVNILKNLNNPNRLPLANRLEKYYPGLKAQIEAITMLPEIVKVYTQKSKLSKWLENNVVQIMIAGGVGGLTSGLGGILAGAGAGMISKLSQNIGKSVIKKMMSKQSPKALESMAEILKKQQERKELTAGEKSQLNQLTTKIIEEGETIKKSKAEQQQRNQIKNYLNKEFGQALPLKKDVPRSFLPAGEKLVAGEGFVKKEKSILELDKRPNILGDSIARNSKKIDKRPENIIGLKQQKTPSVQFSEGIEKLSKGELPANRTLSLGEPQGKLKEVLGNDDLFITQRTLKTKLKQHQLSFDDLQGLEKAIAEPVVIYEAGQHAKSIIVVTDLNKGNEKIAVAIGYDRKGWAEVNEIKSIHPKDLNRLLDEAEGGKINKLHFEDTKKLQAWLGSVTLKEQQPTTIAGRIPNDNLFFKKSKGKNILGDTRIHNKKENDVSSSIIGLKTMKKTGNPEKSEYTMGGKKETAQPAVSFSSENEPALGVSFFAKEQKIATDKKHLKGQWQIERNGEVVTSNVRKGDEFSNKVDFGIEKGEEQYAKNLENVIQGEKSGIIGKVEIKGKQEEIRLTEKSFLHIFKKHRVFNPNNLIATVNRPDYTITNVTTKDTSIGLQLNNKNKINLFKKLDDQHFLVVGANKEAGYYVATHFEVVDRAGNKLAEYLKRGDPLDQKTKDFVVQNTPQTKNILGDTRIYKKVKSETKYQLADQTKSENFKKWFGDWEKDPKNASKVVNEKGEPLVVYHGTDSKFYIFEQMDAGGGFPEASYFSSNKLVSDTYGKNIMEAYLDIKNPYEFDAKGGNFNDLFDDLYSSMHHAKNNGYDGMIIKNFDDDWAQKGGGPLGNTYIVFEPNQIKSATDNIGSFDPNNPDIRYQKHGVANPLEKNISAQQATQLNNIRNGRSVQELADHYGIDIKTVEIITTPEGLKAYGKYGDGVITLAEKIKEGTAPHELFHATFDLVDQGRKESILEAIRKEKKLDTLNAEEFLADNFAEYFRTGRMKGEKVVGNVGRSLSSKLMGMVKEFYQRVKDWITGVSKNRSQVKKLFDEILDGEVDREMLGEMLGNKKKVATDSRAQGAPSLQPPLSRFSIQITDKNSSFYKQKFDALKTKLKINGLSAREFIDEIKLITKDKGNSGYMIKSKNGEKASIRISDHYANAQNNKNRGEFGNNASIVIKIPSKKKSFFKADNEVNLIEYVYKPENLTLKKMENILDSFKEWIDTTEYNDKGYDLKHISTKASLENGEVKYQRVYHGSLYEFEKFDSSHMGKGEGAQAHGWGHYVAVDKEVGKAYAKDGSLYEVEIPDPVKSKTPTGKNYWEQQGKVKSRAVDAIVKQLKKGLPQEKIIELDELIDSWESGYDHSIEGGRMYRIIANTLGSDKKASQFLQSLGYDGIHYDGGRDGEAYVVFDDAKLEIKKHTKL